MFRRDYIMDQIEQMTAALHNILFRKENKQFPEAQRLMDEASRHLMGLNIRSLQALSTKDILELLAYQGVIDQSKAIAISDMLREQGGLYEATDELDAAYASRVKALDLLLAVFIIDKEIESELTDVIQLRASALLELLGKKDVPASLKQKLLVYYEEIGAYGKAEDVLFHLLEDNVETAQTREFGVAFYERSRGKDAAELLRGNLSPVEVEEGLSLLKEKYAGEHKEG